ncbi:hypothetical protein WJT74_05505 [Sphingomicrobium sp. XHP0239]|uniref:hypothetical protein n=1 Tax=Sphingomicrobium maritimum TaxID=3133972 RepID=UPI0031CCB16D
MLAKTLLFVGAMLMHCAAIPAAHAQQRVSIGEIEAAQFCQYFREYSDDSALLASPSMIAAVRSFRSWIVKDCVSEFPTLRQQVEAMLASSPVVGVGGHGWTIDIALTALVDGGVAMAPDPGQNGYAISSSSSEVTLSFIVRDRSGASIGGRSMNVPIETGHDIRAGSVRSTGAVAPETAYNRMHREIARRIARDVSFLVEPLEVVSVDDDLVALNYGSPLLETGDQLRIASAGDLATMAFRVANASSNRAIAEMDGDYDSRLVEVGAAVSVAEGGSQESQARRYRRKRLP